MDSDETEYPDTLGPPRDVSEDAAAREDSRITELKRRLRDWERINLDQLTIIDTGDEVSIYAPMDDRALHERIRNVIGYRPLSVRRGENERIMVPKSKLGKPAEDAAAREARDRRCPVCGRWIAAEAGRCSQLFWDSYLGGWEHG